MNRIFLRPNSAYTITGLCDLVATDLVGRWKKKYSGRELSGLESELYRWAINSEFLNAELI